MTSVFVLSGPSWTVIVRPSWRSATVRLERSNTISPRLGGQVPDSGLTRSIDWASKSGSAVRASSTVSPSGLTMRAVALRRPSASATSGMPRTTSTSPWSNGTVVNRLADDGFVAA